MSECRAVVKLLTEASGTAERICNCPAQQADSSAGWACRTRRLFCRASASGCRLAQSEAAQHLPSLSCLSPSSASSGLSCSWLRAARARSWRRDAVMGQDAVLRTLCAALLPRTWGAAGGWTPGLATLTACVRVRSPRLAEERVDAAGRPAARGAARAGGHMTNSGSVLLSPREELSHVTLVRAAARRRGPFAHARLLRRWRSLRSADCWQVTTTAASTNRLARGAGTRGAGRGRG